jgi:hypothetical protein
MLRQAVRMVQQRSTIGAGWLTRVEWSSVTPALQEGREIRALRAAVRTAYWS